MKRTQVYIPDELLNRIKNLVRLTGKNQSQLMRDGLWLVVQDFENKKSKNGKGPLDDLVGKFHCKSSDPDAALNHNDIYDLPLPWEKKTQ